MSTESVRQLNQPLELRAGVGVRLAPGGVVGTADVVVDMVPQPDLKFQVFLPKIEGFNPMSHDPPPEITVIEDGVVTQVVVTEFHLSGATATFKAFPVRQPIYVGVNVEIAALICQIPNLPPMYRVDGPPPVSVPLECDVGDYHVALTQRAGLSDEVVRAARQARGFVVTHDVRVTRVDGKPLSGEEAADFVARLQYLLSFVKGTWVAPVYSEGRGTTGDVVWEQWGVARCDGWLVAHSWFDPHDCRSIARLFPAFWQLQDSDHWERPLRELIHWYVAAVKQSGGLEGAIIMAHAALELLSWVLLVEVGEYVTAEAFAKLTASDRLRLLLRIIGVETEIPTSLGLMRRLAAELNWQDGPDALNIVRNSLIHPEHKTRARLLRSNPSFEAWRLALWYLELGLLGVCGYDGHYSNRLTARWVGELTRVPWAS